MFSDETWNIYGPDDPRLSESIRDAITNYGTVTYREPRHEPETPEELLEELAAIKENIRYFEQRRKEIINKLYSSTNLKSIGLSPRCRGVLRSANVHTVADVMAILERGPDALLAIRSFGEYYLDEVLTALEKYGYAVDDIDTP